MSSNLILIAFLKPFYENIKDFCIFLGALLFMRTLIGKPLVYKHYIST
jgi:hypothetical protein